MGDLIPFMKVMSCLMFYKCSIKNFYEDPARMYKTHMGTKMSDGISDRKFRAILSAFRSAHDRLSRRRLNMLLAASRRHFGSLFCDKKNTVVSFDDDKQRMRSLKCKLEGFVQQRHSDAGGFGPVQHVAVSQLTHFVLGGIVNSMNSSDAASAQTVLRDLDPGAQNQDDVNLHWLIFAIDRGYRKEAISRQFKAARVSEFGTIMRQRNVADFPYTYSHPESPHNVPEFGVPVGMWSVRGAAGKEELAQCTRAHKGKCILMKSTLLTWRVPVGDPFVPPALESGTAARSSTPGSSASTPVLRLDLTNDPPGAQDSENGSNS
jgi:hypothetical protein